MQAYQRGGRAIPLTPLGMGGGEGDIYRVDSQTVAKIFHKSKMTRELACKLEVMIADPPDDPTWETKRHHSIAWPMTVIFRDPRCSEPAGYTMPAVEPSVFRHAHTYYDPTDRIRRFGGSFTWRHLFVTAFNLTSAVMALHNKRYRVGDLRDSNLLVGPNGLITLIDCDSFQITDRASSKTFHTRVGTGEFLPSELQSSNFGKTDIDRYHSDLFALAVLIFKLLMLGAHPFQAKGPAVDGLSSIEAKIIGGAFPYANRKGLTPPAFAPPIDVLPPVVRALVERAFVKGHNRPEQRPAAHEWFEALDREGPKLKRCRRNHNHLFGSHLRTCPWCRLSSRGAVDPFPAATLAGSQLAAEPAKASAPLEAKLAQLRTLVSVALSDGPLTPQESSHLNQKGTELGLRRSEIESVLKGAARAQPPVKLGPPPQRPRDLATLKKLLAEHEPRSEHSKARMWATLLLGLTTILSGAFAPLVTAIVLVCGLIPAAAAHRQTLAAKSKGARGLRFAISLGPRMIQNMLLVLYFLIPFLLVALPLVAVTFFGLTRWLQVDSLVFWRFAGALGAISIPAWILLYRSNDRDEFLVSTRAAYSESAYSLLRQNRIGVRPLFLVAAFASSIGLALTRGAGIFWPLS